MVRFPVHRSSIDYLYLNTRGERASWRSTTNGEPLAREGWMVRAGMRASLLPGVHKRCRCGDQSFLGVLCYEGHERCADTHLRSSSGVCCHTRPQADPFPEMGTLTKPGTSWSLLSGVPITFALLRRTRSPGACNSVLLCFMCRRTSRQFFYDWERSSHNLLVIEEEHGALAVQSACMAALLQLRSHSGGK